MVIPTARISNAFFDADLYLAPNPVFRPPMFVGFPLAFPLRSDASAIDEQVQRSGTLVVRQAHVQRLLAPLGRLDLQTTCRHWKLQHIEIEYIPI